MLVERVGRWLGGLNVYAVAGVEQVLTGMVGGWLAGAGLIILLWVGGWWR